MQPDPEADSRTPTHVRTREAVGFAMFDFANSSYTTVIVTVVYAIVFSRLIVADAPDFRLGNLLWSVSLATSYALVVVLAPIVGAFVDARAAKKRALALSAAVTVVATASLYFADHEHVPLAMLLVIVSNTGFALGESLVAAFLPELGPASSLGRISGAAWALGYFGGLASTAIVLAGLGPATLENREAMRFVGPITAAFFAVGSIPTFVLLRERGTPRAIASGSSYVRAAFGEVRTTLAHVRELRDLAVFLVATFFAMAGLGIVIAFAFVYGDQIIHWSRATQGIMFVLTQLSASVGAVLFGRLQGRLGDLATFRVTLLVWIAVALLVPGTNLLAAATGAAPERVFLVVGVFAGLCLGATQSASRTIVALFSPASRIGEMTGFWGLAAKLAQMTGLLALGVLQRVFGLERAIYVCVVFFALALAVAMRVDETRGRAAREGLALG